jgi:hypothetical protein
MSEHNVFWIVIQFLGAISAIPVLVLFVKKIFNLFYMTFSFRYFKIRATGRRSYSGSPQITIKIAFTGKEDIIVEDVVIQSKLLYPRPIDGILAWIQLGIGYFIDDVKGLHNVLGDSFLLMTWIPSAPVHRINISYIRKPLSIIFGIIIFYYFIVLLIMPLFWPFLFMGPYWELKLSSTNEKIRLSEKDSKIELKRPFILKSGIDNSFIIGYQPSIYFNTLIMQKVYIRSAKISYIKEPSKLRTIRLPREKEYIWKVKDVLKVKVSGKMRRYSVNLGISYVNVNF